VIAILVGYLIYRYVAKGSGFDATSYLVISFWLVAIVGLTYWSRRLWAKHVGGEHWLWLLYPGAAVYRLSRAAGALVMGCSITELRLYEVGRAGVQHSPAPGHTVGRFVVCAVPVVVGLLAIGVVASWCDDPIRIDSPEPSMGKVSLRKAGNYLEGAWEDTRDTWERVIRKTDFQDWRAYLFIYLAVVLAVGLAPEKGDVVLVVCGFLVLGVGLFLLDRAGLSLLKCDAWVAALRALWRSVAVAAVVSEAVFVFVLVVVGCMGVFKSARSGMPGKG